MTIGQAVRVGLVLLLASGAGGCGASEPPAPPPEGFVDVRDTILRLCADTSNTYECARAVEQYRLGEGVPGVTRLGRRLTIALGTGAILDLTDAGDPHGEDYVAYRYAASLACFGHHLVLRLLFDDARYVLIHPGSGARLDLVGVPTLAPDCERLLAVSGAPDAGSALQVWRLTDTGRATLEWVYEPDGDWVPGVPVWTDATRLTVPYTTEDEPQTRRTLSARLYTDGWRVEQ